MSGNTIKNQKFNYISDQAIMDLGEDDFRHAEIAKTLNQIVLHCPTPFTIGLFGSWGTGKTTISNFFQKDLINVKNIAVIFFDVWKFEKDSLRRHFLITVERQLKERGMLPSDFELDKTLFSKISRNIETEIKFSWKKLFKSAWVYLLVLIAVFLAYLLFSKDIVQAIGFSFLSSLILALFQTISQSMKVETLTVEQDRLSQPDEFEKQFDRILAVAKIERLIIIIDNLDRCTHEKAIEILSSVKTFLEKKKCIYIFQCDEKAIKDHLKKVYDKIDPDEYLRKFFNTIINIPDFIKSDLDTYADKLLQKTNITEFNIPGVSYIITTAYRENPRRIKQFINMLISHFLLAKERESGPMKSLYPEGVITKNVSFLAKFLILRHNWPEFFDILKEDPMILEEINLSYRDSRIQLPKKVKEILEKDIKLNDFLRGTQLTITKYPRAFLYLKQSEEEQKIPESEDIRSALLDGKQGFIEDKFKAIKDSQDLIAAHEKIVLDLLEAYSERVERLFNITNVSIKTSRNVGINFSQNLYDRIADLVNSQLKKYFVRFDPEDIFVVLERCSIILRNPVITYCVELLEIPKGQGPEGFSGILDLDKYQKSLIRQIATHISWFDDSKPTIQNVIASKYSSDLEIIESLCQDTNLINFFLSELALSKIIEQISDSDVQEIKEGESIKLSQKLKILESCINLITTQLVDMFIKKLTIILRSINTRPFTEAKRQFLAALSNILVNFDLSNVEVNNFCNELINGFNAAGSDQYRSEFITPMILLAGKASGNSQVNLDQHITTILSNYNSPLITKIISELTKLNEKSYLEVKYKNILFRRATQAIDIFYSLWDGLSNLARPELFINMMNTPYYKSALDKLKSIDYKIDKSDVIASAIADKSGQVGINEQSEFYLCLLKLDCGGSVDVRNKFANRLKTLLIANEPQSEEVGYNYLKESRNSKALDAEICKSIINDVIENLDRRDILTRKNEFVLKSVKLLWNDLGLAQRDKFVSLIVYKLIEKNSDMDTKKLGLFVLKECKSLYTEHKSHLEHLLSLIETTTDPNSKIQLANELINCKPEDIQIKEKNEKPFWNKVQTLTETTATAKV